MHPAFAGWKQYWKQIHIKNLLKCFPFSRLLQYGVDRRVDGRSVSITSVDNTEYYTLPDPTSDYTSEESGEQSGGSSGSSPPRHSPPRREEGGSGGARRPPAHPSGLGPRRRAVVLCQYRRKSVSEVRIVHSLTVCLP